MGESTEQQLKKVLDELQELQKLAPSRQRAVLITDVEKALAWAKVHEL